jgi:excisionase family DNA binding protein
MTQKAPVVAYVYTAFELASLLRVGPATIRTMCQAGKLGAFKVGEKHWRIPQASVRKMYPHLFVTESPAA